MNDSEYDEKWERRRRVQRVVFAIIAITVVAGLAAPLVTSLV